MTRISNYKARKSRRGTHLHPAARPFKPWWYNDKELREFCNGTQPAPVKYVPRDRYA
jgi:hypothetical protein